MSEAKISEAWPEYLMIRDTKLHDDAGGLGQRIFTTAGAGYEKVKYIRADLAHLHPQPAELNEVSGDSGELPPLPPVDGYDKRVQGHYSAEQMRDYARNAIRSAKQEQACSGMGIDKMAKELLERHTVAVPVAVEDGRCFMVREQDALDAIRAALAATGKQQVDPAWSLHDRVEFALRDAGFDFDEASRIALLADRQQVGEVQGDALVASLVQIMNAEYDGLGRLPADVLGVLNMAAEALAARQPLERYEIQTENGPLKCGVAVASEWDKREEYIAELEAKIAARQPGAQEAVPFSVESKAFEAHAASRKLNLCQHPLHYLFLDRVTDEARQAWKAALAFTPPAQGIDLGQFIALAKFGEEFAFSAEKQPHSRVVYSQASRLLALIDSQPDAEPGVES